MKDQFSEGWNETARYAAMGAAGGLVGWLAFRLYWKGAELIHGMDVRALRGGASGLEEEDVAEQMQRDRIEATGETIRMAEGQANQVSGGRPHDRSVYTIHWSYPVIVGAVYGIARGDATAHPVEGVAGGAALWASVDELLAPLSGSHRGSAERPVVHHIHRLLSHMVMGAASVATTQALHDTFPSRPATRSERVRQKIGSIASSVRDALGQ